MKMKSLAPQNRFWIAITLILLSSLFLVLRNHLSLSDDAVVARVGNRAILKKELRLRNQEQRIENPNGKNELSNSLTQLVETEVAEILLENHRLSLTATVLQAESSRIDRESLLPGKLQEIKNSFESERDYHRFYVRPLLAKRYLEAEVFLKDPSIQREKKALLESFEKKITGIPTRKRVQEFKALAYREGIELEEQKLETEDLMKLPELKKLKPQEPTPLRETREHFYIHLRTTASEKPFELQIARVRKILFEQWFLKEAKNIPIECADASLCEPLLRKFEKLPR
ncbi:hypothetical protein EBZ37_12265 [bacterium]|nr:hypothetical protein [bacterium]